MERSGVGKTSSEALWGDGRGYVGNIGEVKLQVGGERLAAFRETSITSFLKFFVSTLPQLELVAFHLNSRKIPPTLASTSFCGFIVIYMSGTVIRLPASSRSS